MSNSDTTEVSQQSSVTNTTADLAAAEVSLPNDRTELRQDIPSSSFNRTGFFESTKSTRSGSPASRTDLPQRLESNVPSINNIEAGHHDQDHGNKNLSGKDSQEIAEPKRRQGGQKVEQNYAARLKDAQNMNDVAHRYRKHGRDIGHITPELYEALLDDLERVTSDRVQLLQELQDLKQNSTKKVNIQAVSIQGKDNQIAELTEDIKVLEIENEELKCKTIQLDQEKKDLTGELKTRRGAGIAHEKLVKEVQQSNKYLESQVKKQDEYLALLEQQNKDLKSDLQGTAESLKWTCELNDQLAWDLGRVMSPLLHMRYGLDSDNQVEPATEVTRSSTIHTNFPDELEERAEDFLPSRTASTRGSFDLFAMSSRSDSLATVKRTSDAESLLRSPSSNDLDVTPTPEVRRNLADCSAPTRCTSVSTYSDEPTYHSISNPRDAQPSNAEKASSRIARTYTTVPSNPRASTSSQGSTRRINDDGPRITSSQAWADELNSRPSAVERDLSDSGVDVAMSNSRLQSHRRKPAPRNIRHGSSESLSSSGTQVPARTIPSSSHSGGHSKSDPIMVPQGYDLTQDIKLGRSLLVDLHDTPLFQAKNNNEAQSPPTASTNASVSDLLERAVESMREGKSMNLKSQDKRTGSLKGDELKRSAPTNGESANRGRSKSVDNNVYRPSSSGRHSSSPQNGSVPIDPSDIAWPTIEHDFVTGDPNDELELEQEGASSDHWRSTSLWSESSPTVRLSRSQTQPSDVSTETETPEHFTVDLQSKPHHVRLDNRDRHEASSIEKLRSGRSRIAFLGVVYPSSIQDQQVLNRRSVSDSVFSDETASTSDQAQSDRTDATRVAPFSEKFGTTEIIHTDCLEYIARQELDEWGRRHLTGMNSISSDVRLINQDEQHDTDTDTSTLCSNSAFEPDQNGSIPIEIEDEAVSVPETMFSAEQLRQIYIALLHLLEQVASVSKHAFSRHFPLQQTHIQHIFERVIQCVKPVISSHPAGLLITALTLPFVSCSEVLRQLVKMIKACFKYAVPVRWTHFMIAVWFLYLAYMFGQVHEAWFVANTSNMREKVMGWRGDRWDMSVLQYAQWHLLRTIERQFYRDQYLTLT